MAEYYDKQRKALEDDLRMFQEAERDRTYVRDPKFSDDDIRKAPPEIGPVDESLKLEEPDYDIPWSGEIENNKKVLGNAKDLAKISVGDFSDSYLPEEAQKAAEYLSMIDPSALGGKLAAGAAGKAIVFPSVAHERAFWRELFKGDNNVRKAVSARNPWRTYDDIVEGNVNEMMNMTNTARDNYSTAVELARARGIKPMSTEGVNSGVVGADAINVSTENRSLDFALNKAHLGANDRLFSREHELKHLYDMLLGRQKGLRGDLSNGKYGKWYDSVGGDVNAMSASPEFKQEIDDAIANIPQVKSMIDKLNTSKVKDLPKKRGELLAWIDNEMSGDPLWQYIKKNDREAWNELHGSIEDYIETTFRGPMQTPSGGRVSGAHKGKYALEKKDIGEDASVQEATANFTSMYARPSTGRWMKQYSKPNENYMFPERLDDSSIDKDALFQRLENSPYYYPDENDMEWSVPTFKYKYNGPKYVNMLEDEVAAVKPAGYKHTEGWKGNVDQVGDRWGRYYPEIIEDDYDKLKELRKRVPRNK